MNPTRLCECGCGLPVNNRFRQGHNKSIFGHTTIEERFWLNLEKMPTGCWEWRGTIRGSYGRLRTVGRNHVTAHRYSYELVNGPIPEGLEIDHLCRNGICVNPAHLEAVTHSVNVLRCDHHKRRVTHCPQGHRYEGDNLVINSQGRRCCRSCINANAAKYREQKRVA